MLDVVFIIVFSFCRMTEGYEIRGCAGEEVYVTCLSGQLEDIYGDAHFNLPGSTCTNESRYSANFVEGGHLQGKRNLQEFLTDICQNRKSCTFLIDTSWQLSEQGQVYSIIYMDVEYRCSSLTYYIRACPGAQTRLTCSAGHYVDNIFAMGGFGPPDTPCTSRANCSSSIIQELPPGYSQFLELLLTNTCKYEQTCDIFVNSSWQTRPEFCKNHVYNIVYMEVGYGCFSLQVRACAGQGTHLKCSTGYYVEIISAVGGFGPPGLSCSNTANCLSSYVRESLPGTKEILAALTNTTCKHEEACIVFVPRNWQSPPAYCHNDVYNIVYIDLEYKCTPSILDITPSNLTPVPTTKNALVMTRQSATTSITLVTSVFTSPNTPKHWLYYIIAALSVLILILIIIITVITVKRKRSTGTDRNNIHLDNMATSRSTPDTSTSNIDRGYEAIDFRSRQNIDSDIDSGYLHIAQPETTMTSLNQVLQSGDVVGEYADIDHSN